MAQEGGRHVASRPSRRVERVLLCLGAVALAVGVIGALMGAGASGGFLVLGASCMFGMVLERMRTDPSAWRLRPSHRAGRVVLLTVAGLVRLVALASLLQIASSL